MSVQYSFQQTKPKVFCIGLGKTGTTSIGDALELLGMKRLTWRRPLSAALMRAVARGDFPRLFETAYAYDALEDFPWPLVYRELDAHFPNAKFILTVRKDPAAWLSALTWQTVGKSRRRLAAYKQIYGYHYPHENPQAFIDYYAKHAEQVTQYFADKHPGKLLELCFERGDGWNELCPFLELPVPDVPFPHSNRRRQRWYKALYLNTFMRKRRDLILHTPRR